MQFEIIVVRTRKVALMASHFLSMMGFIHMVIQIQFRIECFVTGWTFDVFFHWFFGQVGQFFRIWIGFSFTTNPTFFSIDTTILSSMIVTSTMRSFMPKNIVFDLGFVQKNEN